MITTRWHVELETAIGFASIEAVIENLEPQTANLLYDHALGSFERDDGRNLTPTDRQRSGW